MKLITASITVEHMNDMDIEPDYTTENFTLELHRSLPDDGDTLKAVQELQAELARRHQFINARKTN